MAQGLFTRKQHIQGLQQKTWPAPLTYAGLFNGTNQTLTITAGTTSNIPSGNDQYTIEAWINPTYLINPYHPIIGWGTFGTTKAVNAVKIEYLSATDTRITNYWWASDLQSSNCFSLGLMVGNWTHVACTFDGTTRRIFCNGNLVGSDTPTGHNVTNVNPVIIGADNGSYFTGYISNMRVVKGVAVYTANFAPPTAPLTAISGTSILTLQNATFIDNSSNAFAITNNNTVTTALVTLFGLPSTPTVDYLVVAGGAGSGSALSGGGGAGGLLQGSIPVIAGTSYTVTVGAGGAANLGYGLGNPGQNSVFGSIVTTGGGGGGSWANVGGASGGSGGGGGSNNGTPVTGGSGISGQGNAGGTITTAYSYTISGGGGGGAGTPGGGGSNITNTVDRGAYGYAGGMGVSTAIIGPVYAFAGGGGGFAYGDGYGTATGGAGGAGGGGAGGCASGAVIAYAQGGVGYNSGGTPSAVWYGGNGGANSGGGGGGASIANGGGGGGGGSGIVVVSYPDIYAAAASTTGSPTVSTSGSGSILFSGTTDNIYAASNAAFAVGTNNFTVEFWANWTAWASTNQRMILMGQSGSSPIAIYRDSASNVLGITINGADKILYTWTPTLNTWYHVAVVRSGTSTNQVTLYINGTNVGTGTSADSIAANNFFVGGLNWASGYNMQGYMSNVRFVNGTAVYTGNFTPSTTPLTVITNTSLLLNTVSGAQFADSSTNSFTITRNGTPAWNQASPFGTGLGYKNRVYTWTSSGSITF